MYTPDRRGRVRQVRRETGHAVGVPLQVVQQQVTRRRREPRRPGRRRGRRSVGGVVEQLAKQRHPRDTVGDHVVHLDEHADPAIGKTRQQPQLPQWAGRVQRALTQFLTGPQQLRLTGGCPQGVDVHVIGDVEGPSVHPQRAAQTRWWTVDHLAEPGSQVQPAGDPVPYLGDAQLAVTVEQPDPVEDRDHADVRRPAALLRHKVAQGRPGQPVDPDRRARGEHRAFSNLRRGHVLTRSTAATGRRPTVLRRPWGVDTVHVLPRRRPDS